MEKVRNPRTYFFRFEAHRNASKLQFCDLNAELSAGRYGLSVEDITDAFVNKELYPSSSREGDEAERCFALAGSFALSVPVSSNHPVIRAFVALGFDEQDVRDDIEAAVARVGTEVSDE